MEEQKTEEKTKEEITGEDKVWALTSYLWFLCLVPLLLKRDSKFIQFHAKQGLIMAILFCFVWIPFFGWLLALLLFAAWIIVVVKALTGQYWKIPLVGDIVKKLNL